MHTPRTFRVFPKLLVVLVLALLAGAATLTAARAASRHGGPDVMFMRHESKMDKADTNGDGAVDAAEWNALFTTLDADKNGKLDGEELMRHHGFPPPEAFALMIAHHADTDRDGKVSAAEWRAHVAEIDENGDGNLSAGELKFRHRMREGDSEESATASLPPFAAEWDTNGNGTLEASELDALFAKADEDGDGVLTFPHRERHGFRR